MLSGVWSCLISHEQAVPNSRCVSVQRHFHEVWGKLVFTHADGNCRLQFLPAFFCHSVCLHDISKTVAARITELDVETRNDPLWVVETHLFSGQISRSRGTRNTASMCFSFIWVLASSRLYVVIVLYTCVCVSASEHTAVQPVASHTWRRRRSSNTEGTSRVAQHHQPPLRSCMALVFVTTYLY